MTTTMTTLREEHQHLLPHIEELRLTADAVGNASPADLGDRVRSCVDFLEHHLVPHALAEDDVLYPVVARLLGGPEATATMRRDHVEVGRLTAELSGLGRRLATSPDVSADLRRVLYGLYAIVRLHFAKEEEVYVPLLEASLSDEEAATVMGHMASAHHRH